MSQIIFKQFMVLNFLVISSSVKTPSSGFFLFSSSLELILSYSLQQGRGYKVYGEWKIPYASFQFNILSTASLPLQSGSVGLEEFPSSP